MGGFSMHRRSIVALILAAFGTGLCSTTTMAEVGGYPNRMIRMVVPFAPGGGVDTFGRLVAEKLRNRHGVTMVVENRSGGNGTVGGNAVRQAAPDGYTILFSASTHILAKQVMRDPPYDPVADFTPVARVGLAPLLLVMSSKMPQTSIGEIVADARKNPGQWTFGISSLGSAGHLATVAFNQIAGLNLTIAPYRGTAPALNDVAGGHIQLMLDPILALLPMARGGKVKAVAITTDNRSSLAPDIPTTAESGMPGLNFGSWYGVWGPRNLPNDVTAWLNASIGEAVKELSAEGRLTSLGIEPVAETPEEFARFIESDLKRSTDLLRAANFQPE
jgi:tripartite-type tricarboxylate transporter receptor subunit TctC